MFFLPRHKFRRRMGLGQNLTDLKAQEEKHEQEQDEGYYPQEPQEPPEVQAMKDKLKRMTAYHADDYDVAESDLHSELVLATTKVSFLRGPKETVVWGLQCASQTSVCPCSLFGGLFVPVLLIYSTMFSPNEGFQS
eukprot:1159531-Pelagomonas_calceolata.AAC.1